MKAPNPGNFSLSPNQTDELEESRESRNLLMEDLRASCNCSQGAAGPRTATVLLLKLAILSARVSNWEDSQTKKMILVRAHETMTHRKSSSWSDPSPSLIYLSVPSDTAVFLQI